MPPFDVWPSKPNNASADPPAPKPKPKSKSKPPQTATKVPPPTTQRRSEEDELCSEDDELDISDGGGGKTGGARRPYRIPRKTTPPIQRSVGSGSAAAGSRTSELGDGRGRNGIGGWATQGYTRHESDQTHDDDGGWLGSSSGVGEATPKGWERRWSHGQPGKFYYANQTLQRTIKPDLMEFCVEKSINVNDPAAIDRAHMQLTEINAKQCRCTALGSTRCVVRCPLVRCTRSTARVARLRCCRFGSTTPIKKRFRHAPLGPDQCGACAKPVLQDSHRHQCTLCSQVLHSSRLMCLDAGALMSSLIAHDGLFYCSKECQARSADDREDDSPPITRQASRR